MDYIYTFMQKILPFSWAGYKFMLNALLAVLIIAPVYGLVGTMVVNNRMAFFSDALGHSAMTGIAVGVLLGLKSPVLSTIVFAILFALGISEVKGVSTASADTIISVFSSAAMALGLALLSRDGNFARYSYFLIGDLLSVTPAELLVLIIVLALIAIVWFIIYEQLFLISLNRSLAKSRGIRVRFIENVFLVMVAVLVAVSINRVGILIINSMLILPAASARNIAKSGRGYQLLSVLISVFSGIAGLVASFYANTSAGATIIFFMSAIFFITLFLGAPKKK